MPVNQFVQASIALSRPQGKAIGELLVKNMGTPITIEETNIPNCIAVIQGNRTMLVHHDGKTHDLGASQHQAPAKRRPSVGRVR